MKFVIFDELLLTSCKRCDYNLPKLDVYLWLRFECGTWNSNFEWTLIHGTPNTYVLVHPPFHRFGHQLLHFKLWQDNKCWSQRMIAQDSRLRAYQTFLIFHKDTKNYVGCFCKLVFIRKKIQSISSKKCKCWSIYLFRIKTVG